LRELHHLAQVFFAAQKHDDTVDAGRDPAMRRRAVAQRAQHAAEFLLEHLFAVTRR